MKIFPILVPAALVIFLMKGCSERIGRKPTIIQGDYWKSQALEDIIPYWTKHARDTAAGAFITNLDASWNPSPDSRKYPSMIARHIFSYSVAFMLTGDMKYLDIARDTKDFLIEHGWDRDHGGWFN